MIETIDLYKRYRTGAQSVEAVSGVNLRVAAGEFVAIVGPSGSGKSTLMNVLGCLDNATSGRYLLGGLDVTRFDADQLAAVRRVKIGFVFQGFNLLPSLTALENVALPLVYMGMPQKERNKLALGALARVGLEARSKHLPSEMSGGQQQRVAIARALVTRPPLILADEPTGNLDGRSGREVMALIRQLHREGGTVVLITHDEAIAAQAERRVEIQEGRIVSDAACGLKASS